jgi:dihydropteroate synthase
MPTSLTTEPVTIEALAEQIQAIDNHLSHRHLDLDEAGYFIIYLDREQHLICAKHFSTVINEQGLATDPVTGKVIPARGKVDRLPERLFTGRTAKELCVQLFESLESVPVTQLSHAAYLGRELQKAEAALLQGSEYIQD